MARRAGRSVKGRQTVMAGAATSRVGVLATGTTLAGSLVAGSLVAGSLLAGSLVAGAATDDGFSGDGRLRTAGAHRSGAVGRGDGSALAVGISTTDATDAAVVRIGADGNVLGTATVAGSVRLDDLRGVAAAGSDTVAQFHTDGGPALTRIGPDGQVVAGFGGGDGWVYDTLGSCGGGDGQIGDLAVAPDGTIFTVAWNFLGNTPANCDGTGIRRYDASGNRLDWGGSRFEGTFVDNRLESAAIAVDGSGNVYTAGVAFGSSADTERVGVLKVGPSGALATGFGSNGLATFHPGTIHTGQTTTWFGWLAGFSRTDSARTAADLAIDSQGRVLLVGGGERQSGGTGVDTWVARLLPDGSLDTGFGQGGITTLDLGGADYGLLVEVDGADRPVVVGATQAAALNGGNDQRAEFTALLSTAGAVLETAITSPVADRPAWPATVSRAGSRIITAGQLPGAGLGYVHGHRFGGSSGTTTTTAPTTTTTAVPTTTTSTSTTSTTRPTTTTTTRPPTTTAPTTTTTAPGGGGGGGEGPGPLFTGVTPWRALDTRTDGGALGVGSPRTVPVTGRGGIPADAVAVAVNLTVIDPTVGGYLTAHPAGGSTPLASTVNHGAGQTVANAAVVGVGPDGRIALSLGAGRAHVAVDVLGWFAGDAGFVPANPVRAIDTRLDVPLGPGETRTVTVAGLAGAPGPGAAEAVALTITAVDPTHAGHLRAWPGRGAAPHASVLNYAAGQTVANAAVLGVDANGQITVGNFGAGRVHLVIDVAGTFTAGADLHPVTPVRAHDSRASTPLGPGATRSVPVTGLGEVPASGVRAVVVNVTVTEPTGAGWFGVHPGGSQAPLASLLNFTPGVTVANATVVGVGPDGTIELTNSVGATHVVIDVLGWL